MPLGMADKIVDTIVHIRLARARPGQGVQYAEVGAGEGEEISKGCMAVDHELCNIVDRGPSHCTRMWQDNKHFRRGGNRGRGAAWGLRE